MQEIDWVWLWGCSDFWFYPSLTVLLLGFCGIIALASWVFHVIDCASSLWEISGFASWVFENSWFLGFLLSVELGIIRWLRF